METQETFSTKKFILNSKEIEFSIFEITDSLGMCICMINTLEPEKGKIFWQEIQKIFNVTKSTKEKIDSCFE